jgi:hypothetical protein
MVKVFISWSGDLSKALAEIMRGWIPAVLQAAKPYFSPDDIAKGARWSAEVAAELEASRIGLVCLTSDNLDAPWIMFESGALSKSLGKSKVCPILFGAQPSDLKGPLVQFQAAKFEKGEIERVVRMMNAELGESALAPDVLGTVFEMWWPRLQKQVEAELSKPTAVPKSAERSERELIQEILELTRSNAMNAGRPRTVGQVSPRAIDDLLSAWAELVKEAVLVGGPTLSIVRSMRRPLGHMVRNGGTRDMSDRFHTIAAELFGDVEAVLADEGVDTGQKGGDSSG